MFVDCDAVSYTIIICHLFFNARRNEAILHLHMPNSYSTTVLKKRITDDSVNHSIAWIGSGMALR